MKIAFLHPDLGIGGAERLVVDCALALQATGHEVTIFTSHHDPSHAFDETRNGTLKVEVLGNTVFPRAIAGKLSILFATLRQLHLTKNLVGGKYDIDVFIIDQLPAAVPYLRLLFPSSRILFYCHHPDLLLTSRSSLLKKLYRYPFDTFERWCTAKSDQIAVNSNYTRKVFFETFGRQGIPDPSVLYPIVDTKVQAVGEADNKLDSEIQRKLDPFRGSEARFMLSINRFERKKDIDLAISSYSLLLHAHMNSRNHLLIIAGGYDERILENIEYLDELKKLASKFRIPHATRFPGESWKDLDFEKTRILFLPSVSSNVKTFLLNEAAILLYTPTNEHFGIVPLEAMNAQTPVLATNTGGPLETVVDGVTGWLREPDMEAWYRILKNVLMNMSRADLDVMGKAGRERVLKEFSLNNMQGLLNNLVLKTHETERKNEKTVTQNTLFVSVAIIGLALFAVYFLYLMLRLLIFIRPHFVDSLSW